MDKIQLAIDAIANLKFFCFDCQAAFKEDEMPSDENGELDELHAICPKCGSEDVSEEADEIANWCLKALPDGWRPIEEAPRDGTVVIVGHPRWKGGTSAAWVQGTRNRDGQLVDGWVAFKTFLSEICEPTHFQPLPAPPSDKGDRA